MKIYGYILTFILGVAVLNAQSCPELVIPFDGQTGVEVDSPIIWEDVNHPNFVGFLISLGTTPGGEEILKRRSAGVTAEFIAPTGLPDDTTIYVTIQMFIEGQGLVDCPSQSFTTSDVLTPPDCTLLNPDVTPPPSARGTYLSWYYAVTATGYYLSVGTTENGSDIINNLDVGNRLDYEIIPALPEDVEFYVTLVPYNENGQASGCISEDYEPLAAVGDICGSYYSSSQGGVIYPSPQLTFPDAVFICASRSNQIFKVEDEADGARWYKIDDDGNEALISSQLEVDFPDAGTYRLEAYNDLQTAVSTVECASNKIVNVYWSDIPRITAVDVTGDPTNREATIVVEGSGDYEFSLNDEFGEYRSYNRFNQLGPGEQKVFVRDRNGCGVAVATIPRVLSAADFPKFFTPNNDSSNDFWRFAPENRRLADLVSMIHIYDRYGMLIAQILPNSKGWDGTFNGKILPPSDYWYVADTTFGNTIQGHFTLKQ